VFRSDEHVVDLNQLHCATEFGEDAPCVLQVGPLAEEVARQGILALGMTDDVVRPEGGSGLRIKKPKVKSPSRCGEGIFFVYSSVRWLALGGRG
jgi:hypothetical protein